MIPHFWLQLEVQPVIVIFNFIKIKIWIYSSNDVLKTQIIESFSFLGIAGVGYNPSMHIDSSSNTSSCNSSTPSSPAGIIDYILLFGSFEHFFSYMTYRQKCFHEGMNL